LKRLKSSLLPLLALAAAQSAGAVDIRANLSAEYQHFFSAPERSGQAGDNLSLSFEPEFYYAFANRDSVTFTPFVRWDESDSERSHGDIRKLYWHRVEQNWELRAGIDQVFWGVTESVHLVNIVNQIDLVESPNAEELLGQPMIHFTWIPALGNVELFLLPGFRERTFPGRDGRPGVGLQVDNDNAHYASGAGDKRTDIALRWSATHGIWDIGLAHFSGTSREPRFDPQQFSLNRHGEREYIPLYEVIDQTSIDLQSTTESWLLKLEAITRNGQGDRFSAAASGVEYTFVGIGGTVMDLGVIGEYLYDERPEAVLDDDIAIGLRLALNDFQSTELVAVLLRDRDNGSSSFYVEASRRIGDSFRLELEARGTTHVDRHDPLKTLDGDGFVQLSLGYFF